jgi:hypothetical protein
MILHINIISFPREITDIHDLIILGRGRIAYFVPVMLDHLARAPAEVTHVMTE